MDATLFRRIVAGIPRTADTWPERARQDHDLEDFLLCSDQEIAIMATFRHGQEDAMSSALPDNDDEEEDRVAFELGSGTRRPGDIGGSGDRAAIRT
jgi:hypothetical protein